MPKEVKFNLSEARTDALRGLQVVDEAAYRNLPESVLADWLRRGWADALAFHFASAQHWQRCGTCTPHGWQKIWRPSGRWPPRMTTQPVPRRPLVLDMGAPAPAPAPGYAFDVQGNGFRLRNLDTRDATPQFLAWLSDPRILNGLNLPDLTFTLDSLREFIQRFDNRHNYLIGIFDASKNLMVGFYTMDVERKHRIGMLTLGLGDTTYEGRSVIRRPWTRCWTPFLNTAASTRSAPGFFRATTAYWPIWSCATNVSSMKASCAKRCLRRTASASTS